ncbi:hypothetical protein AYO20_10866 [Fonsecaea nubica]|uniref:DUF7770 domain-containing protein n=1 Tax=Fonsecaea nubica TaxID=856822 RepID=A0A178C3Q3_9EURO|nr:hypothetical protein AYO20_10866 [Fonsecaea nubica]OAL23846.1 hypothetical protein AYO20_10866 [Fonsecaea nubica]
MVTVLTKAVVSSDARIATTVRVVVHTYGPKVNDRSWNHWSIYLILADGSGSVRVNMRAEYEGYDNGILEWSDCPYTESNSNISHWDFPCRASTRIRDIAAVIYVVIKDLSELKELAKDKDLAKNVAQDLVENGTIATNAATVVWSKLLYLYHRSKTPESLEMVQGKFY